MRASVPIERVEVSRSQLAELLGVSPARLIAVQRVQPFRDQARKDAFQIVLEPEERAMQTTGTCPPLSDNTKRKPTRKGKR